ncbi:hypothetical protein BHE74_00004746 [Ensete ventricosum]|nr:hypothetical protein BHE74_00004746 [Ensete ventricosum]
MDVVAVQMTPANVNPSSYVTAPPSPRHPLGSCGYYNYTSAPTSPSRAAVVYPAKASDFAFCIGGHSVGEKPTPALATPSVLYVVISSPCRDHGNSLEERQREGSPGEEEDDFRKSGGRGMVLQLLASSASVKSSGSKKWKLKDLFLFRSASEGRATGRGSKDHLRSYTVLLPPSKLAGGSESVGGGAADPPSAHEMYYSPNRAASEELKRKKKKTALPYQYHGITNPGLFLYHTITTKNMTKSFGDGLLGVMLISNLALSSSGDE